VARETGALVVVIEASSEHLELARRFRLDATIDMREHPTLEARSAVVRRLVGARGADVVIELTGVPAAFGEALELVRPGRTVVSIGNVKVGAAHEISFAPGLITRKAIRVRGFVRHEPRYLDRALRFLERRGALLRLRAKALEAGGAF
jgi:L-iditol 2-dehydrogenase